MRGFTDLAARVFDVLVIVLCAILASQIRFDDVPDRSFYMANVAFAAAFVSVFPATPPPRLRVLEYPGGQARHPL